MQNSSVQLDSGDGAGTLPMDRSFLPSMFHGDRNARSLRARVHFRPSCALGFVCGRSDPAGRSGGVDFAGAGGVVARGPEPSLVGMVRPSRAVNEATRPRRGMSGRDEAGRGATRQAGIGRALPTGWSRRDEVGRGPPGPRLVAGPAPRSQL
jgi:hypothetical protein